MKKHIRIAWSLALLLASCRTETEEYKARGPEYFPLRVGSERFYMYDSVSYSRLTASIRYYSFRIREVVKDSFVDQAGNITYRLEQYESRDTGRSFSFRALHTVNADAYGIQRVEQNRRNLVLSFPIRNLRSWYPYFYWNDSFQTSARFQYTGVNKPYANNWMTIQDAVWVKQQYDSTFIFVREAREIYGRNTGLLYKLKKDIDLQVMDEPDGHVVTWQLYRYYP